MFLCEKTIDSSSKTHDSAAGKIYTKILINIVKLNIHFNRNSETLKVKCDSMVTSHLNLNIFYPPTFEHADKENIRKNFNSSGDSNPIALRVTTLKIYFCTF